MPIDTTRFHRKMVAVPLETAAKIRSVRHSLQHDSEGETYRLLIEKGLEALEKEKAEQKAEAPQRD